MKLKKHFTIILLTMLFLTIQFVKAQSNESTITGFIYDESTSETLIGANILIKDLNRGASSNISGYFVIPQLNPGAYELIISYVGYKTTSRKIILDKNENKRIDVRLKPDVILGKEIVVTADSTRLIDNLFSKPVSKLELTQAQISKIPRVIEADLLRTLQSLPGIVPISDFSSAIYVRGGTPDQNLFMVDGIDVYNPEHAFGLFSTFNTDAIKKVEVFKGGFGAEYGGRLSSVINIVNNDGNRNNFEGKASLSLLSISSTLQSPIGSFGSLSGSVRRTYIDQTLAKWIDDVPDYYFIDGNLKATFDLSESYKLSISYFGSKDNLNFLLDKKRPETLGFNYTWGNETGSLNLKTILTPKIFGNFWFTASYFRSLFDFNTVNLVEDNVIRDYTVKGAVEYFYSDNLNFKFGFEHKNVGGGLYQKLPGGKVDVYKYRKLYSLYFTTEWKPSFAWDVEFGIREDHFISDVEFNNIDPRLIVKYKLDETSSLKFSTGIFHQYANRIPRLFFVSIWTTADQYLQGSTSNHFILGYQKALGNKFELEVEAYYKDYKNIYSYNQTFLADVIPEEYSEDNTPIYKNQKGLFNRGDGNSYGIEFLLRKETGAITGWASYAYSKTLFNIDGINQERSYEPRHDRTHAVNIVANIDLNNIFRDFIGEEFVISDKQWSLGLNLTYFSGQPITLPSSVYVVDQFPDWTGNKNSLAIYPSTINAYRLPYYARFDVSLTYDIQYDGWTLSPYLQIFNLLNRKNVWFIQYKNEIKDNAVKQEIQNVNMFPILPSIGVSIKF